MNKSKSGHRIIKVDVTRSGIRRIHLNMPVKRFITGGKAAFMIISKKSGTSLSFFVTHPKETPNCYFVYVLDIDKHIGKFMGTIFWDSLRYRRAPKTGYFSQNNINNKTFEWLWEREKLPTNIELFGFGRCVRCYRHITHTNTVKQGIGAHCKNIVNNKWNNRKTTK